jgi:hypothetical protein
VSGFIRQAHRWVSMLFTLTVIANLFVLPYLSKRRAG